MQKKRYQLIEKQQRQQAREQAALDAKLFEAVEHNYVKGIAHAVEEGANVNARNASFYTPLHIAISRGYTRVFIALLNAGANVDLPTRTLHTPLHLAAQIEGLDNVTYVTALLALYADAKRENRDGMTPAALAQYQYGKSIGGPSRYAAVNVFPNYIVDLLNDVQAHPEHRPTIEAFNMEYGRQHLPIDLEARAQGMVQAAKFTLVKDPQPLPNVIRPAHEGHVDPSPHLRGKVGK